MPKTVNYNGLNVSYDAYNNAAKRNAQLDEEERKRKKEAFIKQQAEKRKKERESYHFGDITKGLVNTGLDIGADILQGGMGYLEGTVDWGTYRLADLSDMFGNTSLAEDLRKNADFDSTGTWFGRNQNVQENIFGDWQSGIEANSWSPDWLDQINQGIGQIGLAAGTAALTGYNPLIQAGVTYTSSYGNGRSEAKRNGATDEEANKAGIIHGIAETISENLFAGAAKLPVIGGFGSKAIGKVTGKLSDAAQRYFGTKAGKIALKVFDNVLESGGEGAEEIISNILVAVGNDIMHSIDSNYTYGMENQTGDIWQDAIDQAFSADSWNQFFSAAMSSALVGGIKGGINTKLKNQIINAYAKDNGMSFKDAKYVLTGEQSEMINQAKKELQRDNTEYNSNVELNEMAENRVLNYAKQTSTENINKQIAQMEQNAGREFTEEERQQLFNELKSQTEDQINSPDRYRQFTLEKEPTDERDKTLYESMQKAGVTNTEQAHNWYNFASKLHEMNKNSRYEMTSPEDLVERGILKKREVTENGKTRTEYGVYVTKDGKQQFVEANIDGLNLGDRVLINVQNNKALEATMWHEIAHSIKDTSPDGYNDLRKIIQEVYGKDDFENNKDYYRALYGDNKNLEDEYINDKLGEMLNNEKFVNRVSQNRNLLQRIIDKIKEMVKYVTSSADKKKLMKIQNQLENKYTELYKEAKFEKNNNAKYSIKETTDGTKYVVDESLKLRDDLTEKDVFNILKGTEYNFEDGDTAYIVGWLKSNQDNKNNKYMYKELFNRHPKLFKNIQDINDFNTLVNYNTDELLKTSKKIKDDIKDINERHKEWNIKSFDTRQSILYTPSNDKAYLIDFAIANLNNGKKIAYAKQFAQASNDILQKIKTDNMAKNTKQSVYVDNIPQNNQNVNYSLSQDSQGRELSKQQQEYFKDSKVRDDNGNLIPLYHGSNSQFTIFDISKSGESNKAARVGFWFTPSKQGAENFANDIWYGDKTPTTYETYLNITNPKIYETIDTSEQVNKVREELKTLNREYKDIASDFAYNNYGINNVVSMYQNYGRDLREFAQKEGYKTEERIQKYIDEVNRYIELRPQIRNLEKQLENMGYDDSYEQFRTDIYKFAGKTAEDANIGGIGMALDNEQQVVGDYVNSLKKQGYDGIIIKNTRFDAENMGGNNDQYVAFYPNQIKNIDNTNPTSNEDIRFSLSEANYTDNQLQAIKSEMGRYAGLTREQLEREYGYATASYQEMQQLADKYSKEYKEYQKTPEFMDALQNYKFESEAWKKGDEYANKIRYYNNQVEKYFAQREAINSILTDNEDTRSAKQIVKEAEKHFGTTNNITEAGYIDLNGKMLDFSGQHEGGTKGTRNMDHLEIGEIDVERDTFIGMGNIRIKPENGGINLKIEPNAKQYAALRDFIDYAKQNNEEVYIDVDKNDGSYDTAHYNPNVSTSKVINDIKTYYETGSFPQQSEYADYYYSLSKEPSQRGYGTYTEDITNRTVNRNLPTAQETNLPTNVQQPSEELPFYESDENLPTNEIEDKMAERRRKFADERFSKMIEKQTYKSVKDATRMAKSYLDFNQQQTEDFRKQITKLAKLSKDNLIKAKNYNKLKDIIKQYANKDLTFVNQELKDAQKDIRNTELIVSDDLKNQITDWSDFRKRSGLNIRKGQFSNVDTVYQELLDTYPGMLDNTITNYADQLQELSEFVKRDNRYVEHFELSDNSIDQITNRVWEKLSNNALTQQEINDIKEDITKRAEARTREVVREEMLNRIGVSLNDIQLGKDISNIAFQRTDPKRVNEKVFGYDVGNKINEGTVNFAAHQNAEQTRWSNREKSEIKDLGIKARSKESAAVQKYGEKQYVNDKGELVEYNDQNLMSEFKDQRTIEKIKNAARVLRQKYDTYIDTVNPILEDLGYDPIPKRQDYFKHFNELQDKFSQWGIPFNRESMNSENLPTDINGLTDQFKPGKNYFASALQRKGIKTTYDAITGIDQYIDGIGNLIFQTETIQRYRALSKLIRDTYGQTHGLEDIDTMTPEQAQQRIEDVYSNKLSGYAAWLDEQANAIAGKKGGIDRAAERFMGRKIYTALNNIKKQVGSNMTGFNIRSAMTNFASAIQGASKTNKLAFGEGTAWAIRNIINEDTDLINKSDFLTNRYGTEQLSQKLWQKITNAGQIFMNATDSFTSKQIWGGKYFEGLHNGLTQEAAIKQADDFAARIMGDRSKGQTAEIFNSKTLGLLTQFQLEVNNQWSSMIHDNKMEFEKNGGLKTAANVTFQLGQLYAMSYMFNNLMKALTGSDVMFDPIDLLKKLFDPDDDKSIEEKTTSLLGDVVNQLPMASIFTGGRIPISEAFQGLTTTTKYLTGQKDKYGNAVTLDDVKNDLIGSAAYYLFPTGYGQLKKTTQGLGMYDSNLPIAGSYTNSGRLRFEADTSTWGKIQAGLFGRNASANARAYYDKGYNTLTEKQVQEVKDLNLPVDEYREIKKDLKEQDGNEEKIDYIYNLPLSDKQKNILANNTLNRKNDVDISNYGDYGSLEEFDYANKNPEKYNTITQITDYDTYQEYKDEISAIKGSYSTTDERKKAVFSYINSLPLNKSQKTMLYKMGAGYSIKGSESEMFKYINSLDISKAEKETIYKELFK